MLERNHKHCDLDNVSYCGYCNEWLDELVLNYGIKHHCTFPMPLGQSQLFSERLLPACIDRMEEAWLLEEYRKAVGMSGFTW